MRSGIAPRDPDWGEPVRSLLVDGTTLYVGGDFVAAGGSTRRSLARWNIGAQTWAAAGEPLGDGDNVRAITRAPNGTLYVGGDISKAGIFAPNDIAALTPRGWRALGQGFGLDDFGPGSPNSVAVDDRGHVYVGGTFLHAGGVPAQHLAQWDGDRWYDLGSANDSVDELLAVGDYVYAAGRFTQIGGITASRIARWNRVTRRWSPLGAGMDGSVHALAYHNGLLYAGGAFKTAGTVAADDVAYWNGTRWYPFGKRFRIYERGDSGGEIGTYVNALHVVDDNIFIGGKFQTIHTADLSASALVNNVVIWNRIADTWRAVGIRNVSTEPGVTTGGHSGLWTYVKTLTVLGNYLYAGGSFNQAGTSNTPGIARWDVRTNTWGGVKAGVSGETPVVNDLATIGTDLWVAGDFTGAGSAVTPYLARFDTVTSTWRPLGSGTRIIRAYGAEEVVATTKGVYWVGNFEVVGGVSSSGIARWNISIQPD
ncbi:MAG: hypothetical protein AVDCRST_MAG93-1553 [uncultured Chloroflexia bacterium]|uniref:Uncharacterized protein n=1 Tax=uncultured Chloroflexia bacterium TaxID=1672391 RepID=A0A6J4IAC7_9CHLR|nr:MAG: hypothetical protein AVDCRST_MAG93-1553 [uncultured Chloroflexia bacterium]